MIYTRVEIFRISITGTYIPCLNFWRNLKNHYRNQFTDCLCGWVVSYSPILTTDVINMGSNPTRDLSKIFLTFMLFGDIHSLFSAIMRISLSIYFTLIQKINTQHIARRLVMQIMRARLASGTQYAVAYSVQDGFDSVRQWDRYWDSLPRSTEHISYCGSVPEIFAIKVESCQKS